MKAFLKRNKIYFETVGTILGTFIIATVAIAALVISIVSYNNSVRATDIAEMQANIAQMQANISARQAEIAERQSNLSERQVEIAELETRPFIMVEQNPYNSPNNPSLSITAFNFVNKGEAFRNSDVEVFEFINIVGSYTENGSIQYTEVNLPIDGYYTVTQNELGDYGALLARLDPSSNYIKLRDLRDEIASQHGQTGDSIFISEFAIVQLQYDTIIGTRITEYWYVSHLQFWDSTYSYPIDTKLAESLIAQHSEHTYAYFYYLGAQTVIDYWTSVTTNTSG